MANTMIGKLPARYSFIINKYPEERWSKCPLCEKLTHERKFPLFIHVEQWGLIVLGKTCKYCNRCELIITHQHELEAELAYMFSRVAPEIIGNEYLVVGTMDKKLWKEGIMGNKPEIGKSLDKIADFKKVYDLEVEPAGWYSADKGIDR